MITLTDDHCFDYSTNKEFVNKMVRNSILDALADSDVVVKLDTNDSYVSIFVNGHPPDLKRFSVRHQVIAGFYSTGAAISVLLSIDGVRKGEHIFNPNDGRQRSLLKQFASQELVRVKFVVDEVIVETVSVIHKRGIRNELERALEQVIANNGRVSTHNWERTLESFLKEPVSALNG